MSEPGPFDADDEQPDPFKGVPFLGDLSRMLQSQMSGQGPVSWVAARQFAQSIVSPDGTEPNVDPSGRISLEQLARVADLQIADALGLRTAASESGLRVTAVNRTQWVHETITAYQPLFERLAGSLPRDGADASELGTDEGDLLGPLFSMMAPMITGMMAGSMVGNLGLRALGPYTLPIPRAGDDLAVVLPNVDAFGADWSLPADDLRLWVCLHEVAHHTILSVPHVRDRMQRYLDSYLSSFEADGTALERRLGELDLSSLDSSAGPLALFGDPELLLGAMQSPAQRELRVHLDALVAVVVGVVDHTLEHVGERLLTSYRPLAEAFRRRRVEADPADRFVEHLFGLELSQAAYDRGQAFVQGVVERAGDEGIARLWVSERELPTPAEVDAPGLWLARIDLPD